MHNASWRSAEGGGYLELSPLMCLLAGSRSVKLCCTAMQSCRLEIPDSVEIFKIRSEIGWGYNIDAPNQDRLPEILAFLQFLQSLPAPVESQGRLQILGGTMASECFDRLASSV